MNITPDQIVYWSRGFVQINATLLFTWAVMALLVVGSIVVTRRLTSGPDLGRAQNLLEVIVGEAREQIRDVARQDPDRYLPFAGTLFVFILVSNVLAVVPGFQAPTASLSTTAALAISVFVAVPAYGIAGKGIAG